MMLLTQNPWPGDYGPSAGASQFLLVLGALVIAVMTVAVIVHQISLQRHRQQRLKLLEEALRNPNLDAQAQRELVRSLNAPKGRALFVLGWFGLFGGIAWLCTGPHGDEFFTAVVVTAMAGACVTLPLALRELEARKA